MDRIPEGGLVQSGTSLAALDRVLATLQAIRPGCEDLPPPFRTGFIVSETVHHLDVIDRTQTEGRPHLGDGHAVASAAELVLLPGGRRARARRSQLIRPRGGGDGLLEPASVADETHDRSA